MLNKFNRSFDGVKNFLRSVSYGCYHRKLFGRYGINPRSYDDFIRQLRFFIPDDKIQVSHHKKFAYFTFAGDFRRGSENYLHRAFLTKTILPEHCLQYISILQLLDGAATLSELVERLSEEMSALDEQGDLAQSIRRRLNELADAGLISKIGSGGHLIYKKLDNPIGELSSKEMTVLSTALLFCKNCSMLSVPGYLLSMHLKLDGADEIFLFRNDHFTRILDDDLIFVIVQAIRARQKLKLEREHKPPLTVIPLSIETDFFYNRQYLSALKELDGRRFEPVRLRLDKIKSLKPTAEIETQPLTTSERLRKILLRVTFDDDVQRRERLDLLNSRFDIELIEESAGHFVCAIRTVDPLMIYPQLWSLQPWAEILSEGLRTRMRDDVREALKNYGDVI